MAASDAGRADLERGHVRVSASIRRRCLFIPDRLRSRVRDRTRRPSPSASKSVEMEAPASLRQNTCCRLLQRHSTTREHNLERPILARIDGRVFYTRAFALPLLPLQALSGTQGVRNSLCISSKGGREPRSTDDTVFRGVQDYPREGCRGSSLLPAPRAKRLKETHRRLRRGWSKR